MTSREVYLAGPVDYVEDPNSWRNRVKSVYGDMFEFIDPTDKFPEYTEDPHRVVEWCLETAESVDGMLIGGWYPDVDSRGVLRELERANMNNVPVVLWYSGDKEELSHFVKQGVTYKNRVGRACIEKLDVLLKE